MIETGLRKRTRSVGAILTAMAATNWLGLARCKPYGVALYKQSPTSVGRRLWWMTASPMRIWW